ncbi:hypothetical protein AAVH_09363 [Aphelenchoides avenae]|nr:hypothetical protein AAVH_09363 [Aphelenchus avenae]
MAPGKRGRPPKQNPSSTDGQRLKQKRKVPPAPVIEREKRDLSAVGKTLSKMEKLAEVERERIEQQKKKEYRQRVRKWARERKEEQARRQAAKAKRNEYDSDLSDEDTHRTVKQELLDDEPESSQQPGQPVPASGSPFSFFELDSVMDPVVHVKQEIIEETNERDEACSSQEPIVIKPTDESSTDAEACQVDGGQPTTEEPTVDVSTETAANAVDELQSPVRTPSQTSSTPLLASTPPTVTPVAEGESAANFFDTVVLQPANPPLENTESAPLDRAEQAHSVEPTSTIKLMFKPRSLLAGTPKPTSFTQTRGAFDIVDSMASVVDTPKATPTPRHTCRQHDEPGPSDAESDHRTDTKDAPQASTQGKPAQTTTAMPDASEVSSPVGASPRADSIHKNVARKQLGAFSERISDIDHLDRELQRALCDVEDEFSKHTTALLRDLSGRAGTKVNSVDIRRAAEKRLSSLLADIQNKLNAARSMADSVSRTLADLDDGLHKAWNSLSEKDRRSLQGSLVELAQENMRLETALKLLEQRPVSKQKEALFARLEHMSKRFDDCQQAIRDARRKVRDKEDRLETKRRSVKNLESENERLKADVASQSRQLAEAEAHAQAQSLVNRNLNTSLNKLSTEWEQRQQQWTAELLKAKGEKATVEEGSIELQRQLDAAEKAIEWYRDGVGKLQAQLDYANHSLKTAENLFAEKSTTCQALVQQVEELKAQLAIVKSEAERERAAAQLLRDTANELKAELGAKDVRISHLEKGATANAMSQSTSELEKRVDQLTASLEKAVADKGAAEELANQRLTQLVQAHVTTTQQKEQIVGLEEQLEQALETSKDAENRLAGATYRCTTLEQRLAAARICTEDRIKVLRTDMVKEKAAAEERAAQHLRHLEESQRTTALQQAMIGNLQAQLDKLLKSSHAGDDKSSDKESLERVELEKEATALNRQLLETRYMLKQEKLRASVAEERAENLLKNIMQLHRELESKDHQIAQLRRQPGGNGDQPKCKALESQINELRVKLDAAQKEALKVPDLSEKTSQLESQLQRTDADLDAARVEALKVPVLQVKIAELESQLKLALDEVDARKVLINRLASVISRGIIRPRVVHQQHKRELAKSQELVATLQSQLDAAMEKKADEEESLRAELEDSKAKLAEALAQVEQSQRAKECFEAIGDNYKRLYYEAQGKRQSESAHAPPTKKPRTDL